MVEERLYIVTYDITDERRWRRVFGLMHGYGHWLQLSVFQCRLNAQRRAEMARRLEEVIHWPRRSRAHPRSRPRRRGRSTGREPGQDLRGGDPGGNCDMIE